MKSRNTSLYRTQEVINLESRMLRIHPETTSSKILALPRNITTNMIRERDSRVQDELIHRSDVNELKLNQNRRKVIWKKLSSTAESPITTAGATREARACTGRKRPQEAPR